MQIKFIQPIGGSSPGNKYKSTIKTSPDGYQVSYIELPKADRENQNKQFNRDTRSLIFLLWLRFTITYLLCMYFIWFVIYLLRSCALIEWHTRDSSRLTAPYLIYDDIDSISRHGSSLLFSNNLLSPNSLSENKPQQIHLSLGLNATQMYVTFSLSIKPIYNQSEINCSVHYRPKKGRFNSMPLVSNQVSGFSVSKAQPTYWDSDAINGQLSDEMTLNNSKVSEAIDVLNEFDFDFNKTYVEILKEFIDSQKIGNREIYRDEIEYGKKRRKLVTYRALLENLRPAQTYQYQIECKRNENNTTVITTSDVFRFRAKSEKTNLATLAIYGDLGLINGRSIPRLTSDVETNDLYDAIIHNGDFAYDLNTHHGVYGDIFMNVIQPIAARLPYMTSVGNHEIYRNFSHYNNRFTMINIHDGQINNFFYSFDLGPVHFVSISTEFYYFIDYVGIVPLWRQFDWLKNDLEQANQQRHIRPWIIVFGHRPFYCSADDNDDCTRDANLLRKGLPIIHAFGLEKLFYSHGVDVLIWSHEHEYERFLPIYDQKVYNGTTNSSDPYENPRAPVHIITGSAGCQENLDHFIKKPKIGSIARISDYGYTRLVATPQKLDFQQVSDEQSGRIIDSFTITKTKQNFPQ